MLDDSHHHPVHPLIPWILVFLFLTIGGVFVAALSVYWQRTPTTQQTPEISSSPSIDMISPNSGQSPSTKNETIYQTKARQLSNQWSQGKCTGTGTTTFPVSPMKIEDVGNLLPYGLMVDAHVTPIDHMYFSPKVFRSARDAYEVRAIADGTLVHIQHRGQDISENPNPDRITDEYRMEFEYSCDFYSYFDLVTSLAPDISLAYEAARKNGQSAALRIPVTAGQLIGRIGGQTLDFGVYNLAKPLPGFLDPNLYDREPWKIFTSDPFLYFEEPIRSQILALNPRATEPRAGKIDYDIAGRLVGNWFKQGTDGYAGTNQERYWDGHLTFAYDYIDPTQIRISVGDFGGSSRQLGVKANTPDPKDISMDAGVVKYELYQFEYINQDTGASLRTDNGLQIVAHPGAPVSKNAALIGTVLAQLTGERQLKFEVFPNKTVSQVTNFTDQAFTYER